MPERPSPFNWSSFSQYLSTLSPHSALSAESSHASEDFFNREISWLRFNERVLGEAANPQVPPLERLFFATIVSSNLDEFFMVRVAEVARNVRRSRFRRRQAEASARILSQIREFVIRQKERQASALREILSVLSREGVNIYTDFSENRELDAEIRKNLPEMNFIIRRSAEPLPNILGERIHAFIRFPGEYAIISIVHRPSRLLRLHNAGTVQRYVLLERWLCARAQEFFPGRQVIEAFPFKLIRDAGLRYRPGEDEDSLEEKIVEAVNRRMKAKVVRLELDAPSYSEGCLLLATMLGLDSAALYRFNLPLDLRSLLEIYRSNQNSKLVYQPVKPLIPATLSGQSVFKSIRRHDVLLHHPYDSFDVIINFLKEAARDAHVTEIYHTLYRTSKESPIMEALKEAAKNGKKVTVYIEIKARFDELNNVRWAAELRKAGVKVVRPMDDFKVHCKMTQVVRREADLETFYTHLGTGNYHPGTAKLYTDLGLLTADPKLGKEISTYFHWLSRHELPPPFTEVLAAPRNLDKAFIKLIREEIDFQKGGGHGHIIAKMNSLVDQSVIRALYDASRAGVKIELMVRGICCLRPGIRGMSDNIRVVSVIDRFLEHSRVYYFRANGKEKVYLSSADWMPRNFNSRYELAFQVKDPHLKQYIRDVILSNSLADNVKAWILRPDGTYERVQAPSGAKSIRSQFIFEELAQNRYKDTVLAWRREGK